jgi:hypothetical protein
MVIVFSKSEKLHEMMDMLIPLKPPHFVAGV